MSRYPIDVLTHDPHRRPRVVERDAVPGLVVEDAASEFCGAVVSCERTTVALEDRNGRRRTFVLRPAAFRLDGVLVTLRRPPVVAAPTPQRTASGSIAVEAPARVARAGRIWVEGVHDAALVERVWGDDLRVEGVVVEPIGGIDDLVELVAEFAPAADARLGVLVDHLVPQSKESRIVARLHEPFACVTGHPYVDVWQAVRPSALGIDEWPMVPRSVPWKEGVAAALGIADHRELWRRVLASVNSYADLEVPLLRAVEELIDFVTAPVGRT